MPRMMADPETYFRSLLPARDELLLELEAEAERESIPIVGPLVGGLLQFLVHISRATSVLELGTASGYSAIHLARGFYGPEGKLLTLERDARLAARASRTFERAGLSGTIELQLGDAVQLMAAMQRQFDFIFIDINKEHYHAALPHIERLLKPNGVLAADNVAFQAADDFNRGLAASPVWQPIFLYGFWPLHSAAYDGFCLARKK